MYFLCEVLERMKYAFVKVYFIEIKCMNKGGMPFERHKGRVKECKNERGTAGGGEPEARYRIGRVGGSAVTVSSGWRSLRERGIRNYRSTCCLSREAFYLQTSFLLSDVSKECSVLCYVER